MNKICLYTTVSNIFSIIGRIVIPLKLSTMLRFLGLNTAERVPHDHASGKYLCLIMQLKTVAMVRDRMCLHALTH